MNFSFISDRYADFFQENKSEKYRRFFLEQRTKPIKFLQ